MNPTDLVLVNNSSCDLRDLEPAIREQLLQDLSLPEELRDLFSLRIVYGPFRAFQQQFGDDTVRACIADKEDDRV